jgi:hypothetical protein
VSNFLPRSNLHQEGFLSSTLLNDKGLENKLINFLCSVNEESTFCDAY